MPDDIAELATFTLPPSSLLMQISNDPSVENFTASFPQLRDIVLSYLRDVGEDFSSFKNILDLGCGPGRFLYAMRPILRPDQKLFACDVNETCATWAMENIKFADIYQNALMPPSKYERGQFDFIYALSVFTHLRLELQYLWAWELHRILKPGGIMLITTSAAGFLLRALETSNAGYLPYRKVHVFGEDDLFTMFASEPTDAVEGQREVATTHSLGVVPRIFSAFELVKQRPISELAAGQTVNLLRRRDARSIRLPTNIVDPAKPVPLSIDPAAERSGRAAFRLASGENGRFRLALEFDVPHYVGNHLDVHYEVRREGAAPEQGLTPLPFNSAYGVGHLIEVEGAFAASDDPVEVDVWVESRHPGLFREPAAFNIQFFRSEPA